MKTKIISVLLCVSMLVGVMSLTGMALDTSISNEATVDLDNPLKIPVGTTDASIKSGVSNYLNISNSNVTYTNLTTYFTIVPSITVDTSGNKYLEVTITEKISANQTSGFQIINLNTIRGDAANKDNDAAADVITLKEKIQWVSKLYDLQMGVRKYGENGNNLKASNIAKVTANINGITSVTDKIFDLKYDTTVSLTATLNDGYDKYYDFYCWIDGSGNVIGDDTTETNFTITIHESCAVFAVYKEIVGRSVVTLNTSEGGKIVYSDGDNLKIFEGDGQVSVLDGSSPTFTFVPDEGYEVSKVIINKGTTSEKEVSSVKTLFSDLFDADTFKDALSIFGTYADATNKDVYSYTFKDITTDSTIDVTFIKSTVYEPASGVEYVPGPELSTGTSEEAEADDSGAVATTLPAEDGAAASSADVANPQTGSTTAIAAFATLSLAAAAAFVTAKKKRS